MSDQPGPKPPASPPIDTTVPHSARVWNYWLGGEDNFPVDRRAADRYQRDYPAIVHAATSRPGLWWAACWLACRRAATW
jgi:hypothetical protein